MEEMSYVFLFTLFCHCRSFSRWSPVAFLIFSPPLQNFHVVLPTKKMSSLFLISRCSSLSLFFSWSFTCLSPTFSFRLCLFLSLYSKFVDMTIDLSLILQAIRMRNQFAISFFVLTLQLSLLHKTRVAMRFSANNLEMHLGCQQQTTTTTTHFIKKQIGLLSLPPYSGTICLLTLDRLMM